jgi:alkylation response protein AidB-like acyl-CoA dehydrogenase
MDLSYPPETEPFRAVIRQWLRDNLPDGWGTPGFAMSKDEKKAFNQEWTKKLFDGGWICASWPAEYGGKGLSLMESVVLNEEFARAEAPLRADFFGDTLVGPTILQWAAIHPRHPERHHRLVPGLLRARCRQRPGLAQDEGRARR